MSRIVHIALKCENMEDLEKATRFYNDIFGIYTTKEKHARGHLSRHMTDGNIDLALMLYDSEDEKEAKLAGPGIQIHHIGVEVADRPSMIKKIEDKGGTIFSDRAEGVRRPSHPRREGRALDAAWARLSAEVSLGGRCAHHGYRPVNWRPGAPRASPRPHRRGTHAGG